MIVVLGRPGLTADDRIDRPAGRIAVAAAEAGGRVEVVGTIGDDADGDTVAVELGQAGVGHAALLRDPAGVTPRDQGAASAFASDAADVPYDVGSLPRLEAEDVDLGLRYLSECNVLVVAEPLGAEALSVVVDAATYHSAALVVVTADGDELWPGGIPEAATVLQAPAEESVAFFGLVGRYAASLDGGLSPEEAWRESVDETGWEPSGDGV